MLAPMSRGIFRRFLRYVTLTLDLWQEREQKADGDLITDEVVRRAVTVGRLAEGMELELSEVFPKHSDLRFQAVQLLMYLQEHGPRKQSEPGEALH
jgi:hypothetical protein